MYGEDTVPQPELQFPRMRFMVQLWLLPRRMLIGLISIYQATLSPDHGPLKHLYPHGYCRHDPTCSEYGKQVLRDRGAVIGSLLAIKRILNCNPWTKISDEKLMKMAKAANS